MDELKQENHLNPIKILSNTPYLQAVHHTKLNLIQAVFYRSDQLMLGEDLKIQATAPCIVMFQMNENDDIERITVSDPNRKLSALLLRLSKKFEINGESFKSNWMAEEGLTEPYRSAPSRIFGSVHICKNQLIYFIAFIFSNLGISTLVNKP